MLPGERDILPLIQRTYAADLEKHSNMLRVALRCLEAAKWPCAVWPEEDETAFAMWLGVHARLCKTYRAIRAVAEVGLVQELQVLMRSMFELAVVATFLLRKEVRLLASEPTTTRKLRGDLYAAHFAMEQQSLLQMAREEPEIFDNFTDGHEAEKAKEVAFLLGCLPSYWQERLKKVRKYSTLSFKETCERLGLHETHRRLYQHMCLPAHGTDGRMLVKADADGRLSVDVSPSPKLIGTGLKLSRSFLLLASAEADASLELGLENPDLQAHYIDLMDGRADE